MIYFIILQNIFMYILCFSEFKTILKFLVVEAAQG